MYVEFLLIQYETVRDNQRQMLPMSKPRINKSPGVAEKKTKKKREYHETQSVWNPTVHSKQRINLRQRVKRLSAKVLSIRSAISVLFSFIASLKCDNLLFILIQRYTRIRSPLLLIFNLAQEEKVIKRHQRVVG